MKTIKPQKLGLLHRTFEDEGTCFFVVTVLACFSFGATPTLYNEVDLWKLVAAELGQNVPLDLAMPKRRGEVLLSAKAYARERVPIPARRVRVKLGAVDKTLWVAGDRRWTRSGTTEPEPFVEMPITWDRAFGGAGFASNPSGKGAAPISIDGVEVWPLPNIEDPRRLVRSPDDRPSPAGFGPLDLTAPERWSKIGTYDERWLRERFPGFAADADLAMFNAAPEDQQIEGFFRGDEGFLLEGLHPERESIEAALPSICARAFVNRKTPPGETFAEVPLHLDTVHLFPHVERGVLVFRGLTIIAEDDARDVLHLVIAGEKLGEAKPTAHYEDVLRRRLDPKKGHLFMLSDAELMPAGALGARVKTDVEQLIESEDRVRRNLRAGTHRRSEENRREACARLVALGLDPAQFGVSTEPVPPPEEEPIPALDDLAPFVAKLEARAEQERAAGEGERERAEAEARAAFAAAGMSFDDLAVEARENAAGPPNISPQGERERLESLAEVLRGAGRPHAELEATLADAGLTKKLTAMADAAREGYRQGAHFGTGASRLSGEAARALRDEVLAAYREGRSLAGRDLTGVDLSGLDLHEADFEGAMMESASLAGTDLRGARLAGAVLARADLSGAKLGGTTLREANLGLAKLCGADAAGADLSWAVLYQADLSGTVFRDAQLSFADLSEAKLGDNDFSGATAQLLTLVRANLSGVKLASADLCRSTFLECTLDGVDLTGARLVQATFVSCKGERVVLREADLTNARFVQSCGFDGVDLGAANLATANLRGTSLVGADLRDARANAADFSECTLREAKLDGLEAKEARFVRADLTRASLRVADLMSALMANARVPGADFFRANLFRADLAKMTGDDHTSFAEANVAEARVVRAPTSSNTAGAGEGSWTRTS
jgi:uncharacterized protein YjbI with pentapeptide repeats